MLKCKRLIIAALLLFAQWGIMAQNNSNSPYTRFGYGNLADRSFGAGRAMGGVGIGVRDSKQINPMNPASYSGMDSLTFLFDFGAYLQVGRFSDGTNKDKRLNGNVEYFALQFPITRWLAMCAGMRPYSFVGYRYGSVESIGDTYYNNVYSGEGSLNDAFIGLSVDIWKKRLAVGANVGYLFGKITHLQSLQFSGTSEAYTTARSQELEVRDVKLDFGIQYTHPLSATENITVGVTYSPANSLNATAYNLLQRYGGSSSEVVEAESDTIKGLATDLPDSYGFGLSYTKMNKLRVAADFTYETWEKASYLGQEGQFKNRMRIGAGVEYTPAYNRRLYFNRIKYRAGVHYSNSYLNMQMTEGNVQRDYGYKEYGASVGFGFPLVDNRSYLNFGFEYIKVKPEVSAMVDEQYFRLTISYAFNELWFFKRKVD